MQHVVDEYEKQLRIQMRIGGTMRAGLLNEMATLIITDTRAVNHALWRKWYFFSMRGANRIFDVGAI